MLINYFKIAYRNMMKQKVYSFITISGLVLGLSMFILFALFNNHLSNFDMFNKKVDRIHSVVQELKISADQTQHSAILPAPLIPTLLNEYDEIENACRYFPPGRMIVSYNDKIFNETSVKFVDPSFFSIFTFNLLSGDKETALDKPYSIVLTQDAKIKYFGDENPIGKTLTLDNQIEVTVTGICQNVPKNSSIKFGFLVSLETARNYYPHQDDWNKKNYGSFILLKDGISTKSLEGKFPEFIKKYYKESESSPQKMYLHPMPKFFFESKNIESYWGKGGASFVVLWIIASLLLIIACINFMNLQTARHLTRVNEVGMRKVIGASRLQLVKQFLGESLFTSLLSLPLALLLFSIIKPVFSNYIGEIFDLSIWDSPGILLLVFFVTILTGLFSGSYPAFYLSAFKPLKVLKSNIRSGKKGARLRKILVSVQFTFSIILIIVTIASIMQSEHNKQVDLGFDRSNIVTIQISNEAKKNIDVLKSKLQNLNTIQSITAANSLPVSWESENLIYPEGNDKNENVKVNSYGVDYKFIETLKIDLISGRSFSKSYNDASNFIINEKALELFPWKDPLGKRLVLNDKEGIIIGVAKDFHFTSLYFRKSTPAVIYLDDENQNYLLVKTSSKESINPTKEYIKEQWSSINPHLPLEMETLENYFLDSNISSDNTSEMTGIIGSIAIFLSCLGLLALSSYSVEQKIKEIGIRKVLGASASSITNMLTKEFLFVVLISNIIAAPLTFLLINNFFNFLHAYPVPIGPGLFIWTLIGTLVIAFLTVSSQTYRAAIANPIESLRNE